MKGSIKSKIILYIVVVMLLANAILGPLVLGSNGPAHAQAPSSPTVTLAPSSGPPGTAVTATGSGFPANELVSVLYVPTHTFLAGGILVQPDGTFTVKFTIPGNAVPGTFNINFISEDHHAPLTVLPQFN
jgi:hypothetical protein